MRVVDVEGRFTGAFDTPAIRAGIQKQQVHLGTCDDCALWPVVVVLVTFDNAVSKLLCESCFNKHPHDGVKQRPWSR